MAKVQDILLNDDIELRISGGDFVCGESDEQHVGLILASMQGDWKQEVNVGVEIYQDINSPVNASTKNKLAKRIKNQLEFDGYDGIAIEIPNFTQISIDCERI